MKLLFAAPNVQTYKYTVLPRSPASFQQAETFLQGTSGRCSWTEEDKQILSQQ